MMKRCRVGSPIFHAESHAVIQAAGAVAFRIGEHCGGGSMTIEIETTKHQHRKGLPFQ